ncbi:hypothetical protein AB0M28_36060, partial [Streptomyces sp. NPDC051940]|uniref:hypothetical protein n=1 Tax=Streptomyces sp. NPDC051940 TaxID=3155675 RepID=UPI00341F86E5
MVRLAVPDADRDQAVVTGGQRAEALPQQHHGAVAERRGRDHVEGGRGACRQTQDVAAQEILWDLFTNAAEAAGKVGDTDFADQAEQ